MKKLILLGLAGLVLSCRSGNQHTAGDPIPFIHMLTVDSSAYTTDQIGRGRYTVIMYFRTDCIHCQKETADIVKAGASLRDINIILLTLNPLKDLRLYYDHYNLKGLANIRTGTDIRREFYKYFSPKSVPFFVIYNKKNGLVRIYEGPVPVDSFKKLIAAK